MKKMLNRHIESFTNIFKKMLEPFIDILDKDEEIVKNDNNN